MSENKAVPQVASPRLLRWSLILSAYDYQLKYKPGTLHAHADAMSRLPLKVPSMLTPIPGDVVLLMDHLASSGVTADQIAIWTCRDPVLSRVYQSVQHGWSNSADVGAELKPYLMKHS
jgi:hypothetical protein